MLEALRIVTCPDCGGPPLGVERDHNFQNLGLANTFLTEKVIILFKFLLPTIISLVYIFVIICFIHHHIFI